MDVDDISIEGQSSVSSNEVDVGQSGIVIKEIHSGDDNNNNTPVKGPVIGLPAATSDAHPMMERTGGLDFIKAIVMLTQFKLDLQKELQEWTDRANRSIKEAAAKLKEDQAELKALRQEIEKAKKEKQAEEEIKAEKLMEQDYTLANANEQIEIIHVTNQKMEVENSVLKREMEDAKKKAKETEGRVKDELKSEQKLGRKLVAKDGERSLNGEMLNSARRKVVEIEKCNGKWKNHRDHFKVLLSQVEKEKIKVESQYTALRAKREKGDALREAEADNIKQMGQKRTQKCKDESKNLLNTVSELKLESIAALNIGYGSNVSTGKQQFPKVTKRLPVFQDICSSQNIETEMECVMCMNEEVSVVFQPCVHQVLCRACNDLHEKEGRGDCPSCRAIIAHRVPVTYRAI